MIVSRVMQCGSKKEVKIRRQETVEEVKCFRCWRVGYYKWECSNTKVERKKRREEETVYMAKPQKVQQKKKPAYFMWKKMQEYCGEENMSPQGTLLLEREWITREMVVIYVDCRGCEGKGVQTYKNQGQEFLLERQVRNVQCGLCQKAQNWREKEAKREEMTKVECVKCGRRNAIVRKVLE